MAVLLSPIWGGIESSAEASSSSSSAAAGIVLVLKEDTPLGNFVNPKINPKLDRHKIGLTAAEKKEGLQFVLKRGRVWKAGSTITIPPEFVVDRNGTTSGTPDVSKSLSNWFGKARGDDVRYGQARLRGEGAFSPSNYGGTAAYRGSFFFAVRETKDTHENDTRLGYLPLQDLYKKNLLTVTDTNGRVLESDFCPNCINSVADDELKKIVSRLTHLTLEAASNRTPRLFKAPIVKSGYRTGRKGSNNRKWISTERIDELNKNCDQLMDSSGRIGDWGRVLLTTMNSPPYEDDFHGPNALGKDFCPNFSRMTRHEQSHAWLWFWTVLGDRESSCVLNRHHSTHDKKGRNINPTYGTGIWTFEKNETTRAWRWQSAQKVGRKPACKYVNTIAEQSLCAVDTMFRQLSDGHAADAHTGNGDPEVYWGPIQNRYFLGKGKDRREFGRQKQMIPQMRRFPGCFTPESE